VATGRMLDDPNSLLQKAAKVKVIVTLPLPSCTTAHNGSTRVIGKRLHVIVRFQYILTDNTNTRADK
jgi:hypothetical protein